MDRLRCGHHRIPALVLLFLIGLFPSTTFSWTTEIIEAARAVANKTASREQEAIAFQNNKAINQMGLAGKIPQDVYQANQAAFEKLNNQFVHDAAAENGLVAKLQQGDPNKVIQPGTDTDVLVGKGKSGKPITAKQIANSVESYNRRVDKFLQNGGVQTGGGKVNWARRTDTDFMPVPSHTTPEEFRRIAAETNKQGGTMYTDPRAAEVEAQLRSGQKVGVADSGNYVEEMQRFAKEKLRQADELDRQARDLRRTAPHNQGRAEALEAEAQLRRSQAGKYVERIDKVGTALAGQHGVAVSKPEGLTARSVAAVSSERGPGTVRQAAEVGAMGEHAVANSTRNYAQTLAEIAKANPNSTEAAQQAVGRSASNLSPGQKGELIEYLSKTGHDQFARGVAKEVGVSPGIPRTGNASGAPKPGVSGNGIAGGVAGGLTLADLYLNYQACTGEGRSGTECFKEFTFAASGMAIAAGAGGVALETLAAMGVSAATISAITAGLTAATLPLALYGTYKAGERWANAPAVEAENTQRQQEKQLLPRFEEMTREVQNDLDALRALRAQSVALCGEIGRQARSVRDLHQNSKIQLDRIKSLLPSAEKGTGRCDESRALIEEINALSRKGGETEERIVRDLDAAVAKAGTCRTRDDAEGIRRTYDNCRNLAARLSVDAAIAEGKNNRLGAIKAEADRVAATLKTAQEIRNSMASANARIHDIASSCISNVEKAKTLNSRFAGQRAAIAERLRYVTALLPERAPSPVFTEELENALNSIATLKNSLSENSGNIECTYGDADPGSVTRMSLESENTYSDADSLVIAARNSSAACEDIAAAKADVESITASANWALTAIGMNDNLPSKADACVARLTPGKNGPAIPTKTPVSAPAVLAVKIGGPQQALQGRATQLSSEITIDGILTKAPDAYAYRWETSDGKTVTGKRSVTFTPKSPGRRVIRLTVTDAEGRSASASATVTIPKLLQTSATADKAETSSGEKVTVSASVVDEDEMCPCTYQWQSDGINQSFASKSAWFKYTRPGKYTVSLDVKDRFGQTATAATAVVVKVDATKNDRVQATRVTRKEKEEEESLAQERAKRNEQDRVTEARLRREQVQRDEEERRRREQARRDEEEQHRREQERQAEQDRFWGDLRNAADTFQANLEREQVRQEKERERLAQEQRRYEQERENRLREQERQRQAEIDRQRREEAEQARKKEQERVQRENEIRGLHGNLGDWRKGLACLEEGKRKFPKLDLTCDGNFMIGTRDSNINQLRNNIKWAENRLRELGVSSNR